VSVKHNLSFFLVSGVALGFLAFPAGAWPAGAANGEKTAQQCSTAHDPLAYLSWWVGKYPSYVDASGRPPQTGRTFFEDPVILSALKGMLPSQALNPMLKGWKNGRVETPIEREGDIIKASFCKPHACPDENTAVFVNVRTGLVQVCWKRYDSAKKTTQIHWYAPKAEPLAVDSNEDCFGGEAFGLWRKFGTR